MKRAVPERSEMFGTPCPPLLLGTLALSACAVAPPQGPTIVALPPAGRDLVQFQQEDNTCRGYAQQRIGYGSVQQQADESAGTAATGGAGNASVSPVDLQQRYDIAYAQCMTASGDRLQAFPVSWPYGLYGYPYPYPYPYPGFYSPRFGGSLAVGFFDGFGPRFHNHFGIVHHDFHRG